MSVRIFEWARSSEHELVCGQELLDVLGVHGHRVPDEAQVRGVPRDV